MGYKEENNTNKFNYKKTTRSEDKSWGGGGGVGVRVRGSRRSEKGVAGKVGKERLNTFSLFDCSRPLIKPVAPAKRSHR